MMSHATLFLVLLIPASSPASAKQLGGQQDPGVQRQAQAGAQAQEKKEERRCAYLGFWGSFHLIGAGGSAAYHLGNDRYVADLRSNGQDDHYWYYAPANGDQFTSRWAFARPDNCGMAWVWRRDRGGWHRYELTRAWGDGLSERSHGANVSAEDAPATKKDVDVIVGFLKNMEAELKEIRTKLEK